MAEIEITDDMVFAFRVAERTAQGFRKKPNERVRAGLAAALRLSDRMLPAGGETGTEWGLRHNGVTTVGTVGDGELMRRDVTAWPDGSYYVGPWQVAP